MNQKFPNDKVTCISPWYELRVNADGSMTYCHGATKNTKEKTDLNFHEWFNHGNMPTEVRESITSGVKYPGCANCYYNESLNLISHRQRRNNQGAIYDGPYFYESVLQSPTYKRLTNEVKNRYPAFLHVTLSNLCNLKCRMCFPEFSSQLSSAYQKIGWMKSTDPVLLDWTQDEVKCNNFLEFIKSNNNIMSLHFMGGEPLYHKKFHDFIEWCVANEKTDYYLSFVTNGTIYDQQLIEKLKYFREVHIEISVENLHPSSDYIRIGSNYQTIKDNILRIKDDVGSNVVIVLRTVPQALSVEHYHTIIDFALENNFGFDNNVLSNPRHLKCNVLPNAYKKEIAAAMRDKYTTILSMDSSSIIHQVAMTRSSTLISIKKEIESIIARLEEPEPDDVENLRKKFIDHNIQLDKFSELKFKEIYPKLIHFYEKYSSV